MNIYKAITDIDATNGEILGKITVVPNIITIPCHDQSRYRDNDVRRESFLLHKPINLRITNDIDSQDQI